MKANLYLIVGRRTVISRLQTNTPPVPTGGAESLLTALQEGGYPETHMRTF